MRFASRYPITLTRGKEVNAVRHIVHLGWDGMGWHGMAWDESQVARLSKLTTSSVSPDVNRSFHHVIVM